MPKTFLEVFPTLQLDPDLVRLLEKTEVRKVSANHDKTHIRIYLHAERLIFKGKIWFLERQIKGQLFPNKDITVKIIESFHLSNQYNAKTLIDIYKESMLDELRSYSVLLYNLLRTADMEFTAEDCMELRLENTIIARNKGEDIVTFLEKIVCERCGLNLKVNMTFKEAKATKHRKNSEAKVR
ncbi:MAG: hypothetical protein J6R94_04785, partial [Agathobacter sp.]|nr:hypothetical protein [Agathobacter sp.]